MFTAGFKKISGEVINMADWKRDNGPLKSVLNRGKTTARSYAPGLKTLAITAGLGALYGGHVVHSYHVDKKGKKK
jgi:hypothetical protein